MLFYEYAYVCSVSLSKTLVVPSGQLAPKSLLVHAVIKGEQDKLGECAFLVHFCLI